MSFRRLFAFILAGLPAAALCVAAQAQQQAPVHVFNSRPTGLTIGNAVTLKGPIQIDMTKAKGIIIEAQSGKLRMRILNSVFDHSIALDPATTVLQTIDGQTWRLADKAGATMTLVDKSQGEVTIVTRAQSNVHVSGGGLAGAIGAVGKSMIVLNRQNKPVVLDVIPSSSLSGGASRITQRIPASKLPVVVTNERRHRATQVGHIHYSKPLCEAG